MFATIILTPNGQNHQQIKAVEEIVEGNSKNQLLDSEFNKTGTYLLIRCLADTLSRSGPLIKMLIRKEAAVTACYRQSLQIKTLEKL